MENDRFNPDDFSVNELVRLAKENRVLVLPCPLGTPVLRIRYGMCDKREQNRCSDYCDGWAYCEDCWNGSVELENGRFCVLDISDFGKGVFLEADREKAEKVRAKLEVYRKGLDRYDHCSF